LSAALALARRGVDLVVLERGTTESRQSRASTFHPPTLQYLAEVGITPQLLEAGILAPLFQLRERSGEVIGSFDLSELADVTPYPYRLQCEQNKLCGMITNELEGMANVLIRYESEVVGVEQGAELARVHCGNGVTYESEFVIGADGAHSSIRSLLGVRLEGVTYPERFLIASTTFDVSRLIPGLAHVSYIADPTEWAAVIHSPDHWRVMFPLRDDEGETDVADSVAVKARLSSFFGKDSPSNFPLSDVAVYSVHRRAVSHMRMGRVLLIGDAAHLNNPLGGQGMNSGIHDAMTLAKTLVGICDGGLSLEALNAWAEHRQTVARDYVGSDSHATYAALREPDPERRRTYREALFEMLADDDRRRSYLLRSSMLATAQMGLPGQN
jgi:3-(3-hydroxy-phenyl)propionate hydroxylase